MAEAPSLPEANTMSATFADNRSGGGSHGAGLPQSGGMPQPQPERINVSWQGEQ